MTGQGFGETMFALLWSLRSNSRLLSSFEHLRSSSDLLLCVAIAIVAVSTLAMIGICFLYHRIKPLHISETVPGPKRLPLIGITKYLNDHWETWPSVSSRLSEEFNRTWGGPVPRFGGLSGAYFLVVDEKSVKHILSDAFGNFVKGPVYKKALEELLGNGIFPSDPQDKWKLHRKIASNMFSRNLLRHSAAVTKAKLDEMSQLLEKGCALHAEKHASFVIDLQDLFFRMTIDTFAYTAFGVELESVRRERQHPFALAFDEIQTLSQQRFVDPLFQVKRFLGIGHRERRIREQIKVVDDFAERVINGKRRSSDEGHALGPDLLSRFLESSERHGGDLPTNKELRDIIMNFVLAGRDTTACALSWAFYELSRHPDVVQEVVNEVVSTCSGHDGDDLEFSYDSVARLRYTHAVAMEVLRLHPSVPCDVKYAVDDDILPDGTRIPAGAAVVYLPFAMGRSRRIWGDDALEFKPERFLDCKEPSAFKYIAFNAGPRLCLGKPLALMNIKMTLAYLLCKFNFEDVFSHSGEYKWTLVLSMKNGFPVKITKRK